MTHFSASKYVEIIFVLFISSVDEQALDLAIAERIVKSSMLIPPNAAEMVALIAHLEF